MAQNFQKRQGDLFFAAVKKKPDGRKEHKSPILALGEATGHSHKIFSPSVEEIEMSVDPQGNIYMKSDKTIVISHDEHADIELPPGQEYCMSRQREYDAVEQERVVAD